ncbi:ATP-binding protein [Crossiella cryophila]|uniref:DNA-binding CsgD family transcriptional regulator n=1 Tax=Crossiella cryophila TaxID=43355 RepID=A0A7W7CB17_9PSEU|nr:LuxR family transcriptional regulator [Crossiella cryophila]MBB4677860.1 DNA-binding CsgD family transcriptional regulator [Crossiella cryophila]
MADAVPLVGRAPQVAALRRAVAAPPVVVRLEGEAGVGKTRLLGELSTPGRVVLAAVCQPFREPFPLAPLVDAVLSAPIPLGGNALLGALAPLLPELADRLPPALPSLGDPRMDRHRLYRALREVLAGVTPAVLVLDDLHWADEQTVEFLRFLTGHLPERLALVVAYRPNEIDAGVRAALGPGTTVRLEPLTGAQTAAMAHALLGRGRPSTSAREALHRRTGGVPFAIEELVRDAAERGGSPWAELAGERVPENFREAIEQRLARVAPEVRELIGAAAVFGAPVGGAELCRIAGMAGVTGTARAASTAAAAGAAEQARAIGAAGTAEQARAAEAAGAAEGAGAAGAEVLAAAVRSELLRESGGRYRCRHELAEQAIRLTLGAGQRQVLHRRIASMLTEGPEPLPHNRIAHHLRSCGDLAGWREHAELAADRAVEVGDPGTAVSGLRALLADPGQSAGDGERLALKLGRVAVDGLDGTVTIAVLREVVTGVALSPAVCGELRYALGLLLLNQAGEPAAGYRELARAARELRVDRPELAARVMSSLSNIHAGHQHLDVHLGWLAEAERLAEAHTDPVHHLAFAVNRVTTLLTCGRPEAWRLAPELLADPVDPVLGRHHMRGCLNIVDAAAWLGHYGQADRYLSHGRELAGKFSAPYTEEQLAVAEVLLAWLRGDWTGLLPRAADLAAKYADLPRIAVECRLIEGALAAAAGEQERALRLLREMGSAAPPVVATAGALVAEELLRRGSVAAAVAGIEAALAVLRRTGMWVWASEITPVAVDVLCAAGRIGEARELLAEHGRGIDGLDCPASAAALALGTAVLRHRQSEVDGALAGYRVAAELFGALPRPYWLARTWLLAGECAGPDGLARVRAAGVAFAGLGATRWVRQCEKVSRAGGGTGRKRGRPGYGDRLSPRELETAELAALGRTNRQIAAALELSVRTVEQHVAHALRKLDLASRRELSRVFGERGGAPRRPTP